MALVYPSRDIRLFYACVCLYKHVCNIPVWYHTIETTLQLDFFRMSCKCSNQYIPIHTQTPMLLTVMLSFIPIMWVPQNPWKLLKSGVVSVICYHE